MTLTELMNINRIIIVGNAGSGKSTLAKRLAAVTGHPLTHLDNEYWRPGWVEPDRQEWLARQRELITGDRWIIEGDYKSTMELRFQAAELVILLDINRLVCMLGAARRMSKKRSDLPDFLEEPGVWNREFLEFCKLIWTYPTTGRRTVFELHAKYPDTPFWHIRSRREACRITGGTAGSSGYLQKFCLTRQTA